MATHRHDHDHSGHAHHEHGHDHEGHEHGHGLGHVHAPASFGPAFLIGIALNLLFVVAEAIFGWIGHSVVLLADAGHNLGDVLSLAVAWVAMLLASRGPSLHFTYGWRGSSILAALFNAVLLLIAVGAIAWEAVLRLMHPEPTAAPVVIGVAAVGIAVNGVTALLFASGRHGDINVRGAFLHMAADAAVSLAVVIAGVVILFTGWAWIDPIASLAVCVAIVWGTWSLLRDSVAMSLDAVPPGIDPQAVRRYLTDRPGVDALHDLHIWPIGTTETALTAHLVMGAGHPGDVFLRDTAEQLQERFGISHPTLQIETDKRSTCQLAPEEVV